jgi:hypothetical protein
MLQRTAVTQQIGQDLFEDFIRKHDQGNFGWSELGHVAYFKYTKVVL